MEQCFLVIIVYCLIIKIVFIVFEFYLTFFAYNGFQLFNSSCIKYLFALVFLVIDNILLRRQFIFSFKKFYWFICRNFLFFLLENFCNFFKKKLFFDSTYIKNNKITNLIWFYVSSSPNPWSASKPDGSPTSSIVWYSFWNERHCPGWVSGKCHWECSWCPFSTWLGWAPVVRLGCTVCSGRLGSVGGTLSLLFCAGLRISHLFHYLICS